MPTNRNTELEALLLSGVRPAKLRTAALDRSREPDTKKTAVTFKNVTVKGSRATRRKYKFGFSPS